LFDARLLLPFDGSASLRCAALRAMPLRYAPAALLMPPRRRADENSCRSDLLLSAASAAARYDAALTTQDFNDAMLSAETARSGADGARRANAAKRDANAQTHAKDMQLRVRCGEEAGARDCLLMRRRRWRQAGARLAPDGRREALIMSIVHSRCCHCRQTCLDMQQARRC